MKAYRVHAYFEACASFDVEADTWEEANLKAREWIGGLSGEIIDTTVELEAKQVHVEDANAGIHEIDVEEDPYDQEQE